MLSKIQNFIDILDEEIKRNISQMDVKTKTDNTQKFSGKADAYNKARPNYAKDAVEFLQKSGMGKNSIVADIGSGTGIFSKQLLDTQAIVYAVEPNEEMRKIAENNLNSQCNFNSIAATAENTTLTNSSVDFITVAQAFHWFDPIIFKKECKRILKKDGKAVLLWNNGRATTNKSLDEECHQICLKYHDEGASSKSKTVEENMEKFFNDYEMKEFDNPVYYDKEKFIASFLSMSSAITPDHQNYAEYITKLGNIFDKHQKNRTVIFNYKTVLYIGNV